MSEETKSWWQSSTVLTGIATVVYTLLSFFFGKDVLGEVDSGWIANALTAVGGIVGTLIMIWRRIAAKKEIVTGGSK